MLTPPPAESLWTSWDLTTWISTWCTGQSQATVGLAWSRRWRWEGGSASCEAGQNCAQGEGELRVPSTITCLAAVLRSTGLELPAVPGSSCWSPKPAEWHLLAVCVCGGMRCRRRGGRWRSWCTRGWPGKPARAAGTTLALGQASAAYAPAALLLLLPHAVCPESCGAPFGCRAVGVSNFSIKKLEQVMQRATIRPAVNQARRRHCGGGSGCMAQPCLDECIDTLACLPVAPPAPAQLQVEAHPYFRNQALIDWCHVGGWVGAAGWRVAVAVTRPRRAAACQ